MAAKESNTKSFVLRIDADTMEQHMGKAKVNEKGCNSSPFFLVSLHKLFHHLKYPPVALACKMLKIVGRRVVIFVIFTF